LLRKADHAASGAPFLEGESLPNGTRLARGYGESSSKAGYATPTSTCQAKSRTARR
jgi:hypothetical protein